MAGKRGVPAHQIHRMLGVTYKTAWFMMHRIREAERDGTFRAPIGGQNKVVESDETFVGGKAANRKNRVPKKAVVLSLVERGGKIRSFQDPNAALAGRLRN
jgi:lipoate-protein ligase B